MWKNTAKCICVISLQPLLTKNTGLRLNVALSSGFRTKCYSIVFHKTLTKYVCVIAKYTIKYIYEDFNYFWKPGNSYFFFVDNFLLFNNLHLTSFLFYQNKFMKLQRFFISMQLWTTESIKIEEGLQPESYSVPYLRVPKNHLCSSSLEIGVFFVPDPVYCRFGDH